MKSTTFAIASLLASVAIAQPHGHQHQAKHVKRDDVVWVTDWVTSTEIVGYTTTIWVEAGQAPPTATAQASTSTSAAAPVAPSAAKEGGQFREKPKPSPSVEPVVPAPIVPAPVAEKQPPPPPPPPPPAPPAPAPVVQKPSTTLVPVVVPTTTAPPVVQQPTVVAPPPPVSTPPTTPSAPSTGEFSNADVTFYDTGMGSCGDTSTDADMIVALSHLQFAKVPTANPNLHPYCRKFINMTYKGKSISVKVIDKCMGCKENDLDLSPAGFKALGADHSEGRLHGASWSWA